MASAVAAAATAPPSGAKHSVMLLRRINDRLAAALRSRYRVLNFYAQGAPLPAFLAASAAAEPEPPRAAIGVGGGAIQVDAAFLDAAPYIRCVVTTAAGLDHIDLAECARRGVLVAGAGETFSADVADHAVGLLVDVLRQVSAADRYVRRGLWPVHGEYPLGSKLSGKRVGIIGLGSIGSMIAKRLKAFGCVIQYHRSWREHRRGGVVVNIARGGNIDEAALIRALKEGGIAGASRASTSSRRSLMCRQNSCPWTMVLTAHEAVFTTESGSDLCDLMIGNLEEFFDGKPLLTPVLPK